MQDFEFRISDWCYIPASWHLSATKRRVCVVLREGMVTVAVAVNPLDMSQAFYPKLNSTNG